ncbi:MAG: PDZ domain-containing protein [Mucilaginibacter sp.]
MKNTVFTAVFTLFYALTVLAQPAPKPIYYAVSFPNAAHHEAEIVMTISQAPAGVLHLHMSRSSAGRYATHEFGKNIYNVKAFNVDGSPLEMIQVQGDVYDIPVHEDVVKVSYTLFGNWTDGTYAGIDPSHAHLNMPAVFMWVAGQDARPVKFEFNDLDKYGWKVATQLKHEGGSVYSAPNLQYMMDSPTELSAYNSTSWSVANPDGKSQQINLTVHSDDAPTAINNFAEMVKKVVKEEQGVFGELATYDYGEYTFLDDVHPTNSPDGMEHRNSTCIVDNADKVAGNEKDLLGTFSHEFFHSWNVKRIRPKSLEPFNFEHANMSNELWFAEGFTQYYGELVLTRAGFNTIDEYTPTIAGLVSAVLNTPGAAKFPATQMSRDAVFTDAGVSIDPVNYANSFTTYYYYGGAIALALDLRLRADFNLTLDDYMRQVWLLRGKVMKPYTVADLQTDLGKVTKNPKFAADFFARYINGIEKNDYAALLAKAGLLLRKAQPGRAWVGQLGTAVRGRAGQVRVSGEGVPILSNTIMGTPLYKAGIDAGDLVTKADGNDIKSVATLNQIIASKKPGDKISITYKNRTGQHETSITLAENPAFEVVTFEKAGQPLTSQQQAFRNAWLASKVK